MAQLINSNELPRIEEIARDTKAEFNLQANLLLLIHSGLSVRQVAARIGLSPSGVQYWVKRFRLMRLTALDTANKNIAPTKPVKKKQEKILKKKELKRIDEITKSPSELSSPNTNISPRDIISDLGLPENLPNPGINSDDSMAAAGKKTLLFHLIKMLNNEKGTIDGKDIEALHDMRVATRRMRAAFDVFQDEFNPKYIKPIVNGLRNTGRSLGKVRDLDVFMEKADRYLNSLPEEKRSGLNPLLDIWHNQRFEKRNSMIAYLESAAYKKFLADFQYFLQIPDAGTRKKSSKLTSDNASILIPNKVKFSVPLLIYTRLAHVDAYDSQLQNASLSQFHALRIELKRLRYSIEFFSEVLGLEAGSVINLIKLLQDHLGDLNDADVACNLLSKILTNWENLHNETLLIDRPNPEPVIAYLAYRADERHQLLVTFPNVWGKFNNPEVRRKLALAIANL